MLASHCMCAIRRFGGQKVAKNKYWYKYNTNINTNKIQVYDKGLRVCLSPTALVLSMIAIPSNFKNCSLSISTCLIFSCKCKKWMMIKNLSFHIYRSCLSLIVCLNWLIVCLFPNACVPSSGLAVRKLRKQISPPSFKSSCFSSALLSLWHCFNLYPHFWPRKRDDFTTTGIGGGWQTGK